MTMGDSQDWPGLVWNDPSEDLIWLSANSSQARQLAEVLKLHNE